ncbi:hypothetical protein L249_2651 [Ophiocordyceps polyrhachis-furcata BCC 54312]|uniref:homogentisate 1,2-dioxygenase n=1 Tax=Ophiocordyceps polyrhachis-furcata BCC 54312 TaxID=1330021 RepID=A0A367LST5_9HYPO|nr:hypothetical protein L249_2651 [Ophiocordyceps polyrhachis-furcata BCC 54312]
MPVTEFEIRERYRYQNGFGNHFESEAVQGALPIGQNSPQRPPLGLYAEKLSGTSFTAPRHSNLQTWLYRKLPSCAHPAYYPATVGDDDDDDDDKLHYMPNQVRWDPFDHDQARHLDFVSGLRRVASAGKASQKQGMAIFVYAAGRSMDRHSAFYSADGDLLLVPQEGSLDVRTELGCLLVRPMEMCVLPRGVRYRVGLVDGLPVRGYALELWQGHFALPDLGPVGSNGLANARDFQAPVACFEDDDDDDDDDDEGGGGEGGARGDGDDSSSSSSSPSPSSSSYLITVKFNNRLFETRQPNSPFDVIAWQGNYHPYKYDLGRFNTLGTVSYDHPDPSIYTVLTAVPPPSPGTAVVDFVIFPPRWLVAEDTFRPPWYHRNTMSEFMGLIRGAYDAKQPGKGGFAPGGASLHNVMSAHGPDAESAEAAREARLEPAKVGGGSCAFMFESSLMVGISEWGLRTCKKVQSGYAEETWGNLRSHWKMPDGKAVVSHLLLPDAREGDMMRGGGLAERVRGKKLA